MYNSLVASLLGRAPKDLLTAASPSDTEIVFEVVTQPADRVTIVVDLQSDESYLAGEAWHNIDYLFLLINFYIQWILSSLISSPRLH